jgi:CBS domain-containing protein
MSWVKDTLPFASKRLVTIPLTATVVEAAKFLNYDRTSLIVVCGSDGAMRGVVTKGDVVRQISHCQGCSCTAKVSEVMTQDVVTCLPEQTLHDVWGVMKDKKLKQIPIADQQSMPLGLLYADEALEVLMKEVEDEQLLLREYVMGLGYH